MSMVALQSRGKQKFVVRILEIVEDFLPLKAEETATITFIPHSAENGGVLGSNPHIRDRNIKEHLSQNGILFAFCFFSH